MSQVVSQDYEVVCKVMVDGDIPVTKYKNKITGLTIVLAHVECPIVKGDLTFATEAFDDDGLPHTLEHLVFLGSEEYPFKGVLDLLANKCLASGTNAYTDTDHTNYTLSTAGSDGFLNLLPIYLDHVLFPTLTDSGYLTEVHHINGVGEDAGVVYCEMQAIENTGESRCYLEMLRALYPGKCGYKSETGGLTENFRSSTSNAKVRKYHKEFYHSRNLCVVVTGPVDAEDLFKRIKPIEDKIVLKGNHLTEFNRPWQSPVCALEDSVCKKIQYSSDTDDDGLVYIGWRGPNAVKDYSSLVGISLILDYLNDTAISPIQRDFVECDDPYCSSIFQSIIENSTSCFYLAFESVKKDCLEKCKDKLFGLLEKIANKEESFNMDRMQTIIKRRIVRFLSTAETSPHSIVISAVIGDFLYGDGIEDLQMRGKEVTQLEGYLSKNEDFWLTMIKNYFIGPTARSVCIIGEPSPSLMKSISEDEKNRVDQQKAKLQNELSRIEQNLKAAVKANEVPAPSSMLDSVTVPSIKNIRYHTVERTIDVDNKVNFMFLYDNIKTSFIYIRLLMDTSKLTKRDRLYLPLLSELIGESPIMRDGNLIPYEQVVAEIYQDTIKTQVGFGIGGTPDNMGAFGMLFSGVIEVEIERYSRAVNWFAELLFHTVFTAERVKTVASRIASDIQQDKRKGNKVASCAMSAMIYQSDCNQWAINFVRQQKFLKQIIKNIGKSDGGDAVSELTNVLNKLVKPENIIVHLSLNKDKIKSKIDDIYRPWNEIFIPNFREGSKINKKIDLTQIKPAHRLVKFVTEPKAAIIGVGSVESNYLQRTIRSIDQPQHPDLAATNVLLQYLTQLEGPLWRQLRGLGLSYHYDIGLSVTQGLLTFLLYKSNQVVAAYKDAAEIVNRHLIGEIEFQDSLLESAKSSLIFQLISAETSPLLKAVQSLDCYLRSLDPEYNKIIIQKVSEVTIEDLKRVGPIYLKPLFEDLANSRNIICCHTSKVGEVKKGFEDVIREQSIITLDDAEFMSSLD